VVETHKECNCQRACESETLSGQFWADCGGGGGGGEGAWFGLVDRRQPETNRLGRAAL